MPLLLTIPNTQVWCLLSWPSLTHRCVTLPHASSLDHPLTHSCVTLPDRVSQCLLRWSCSIRTRVQPPPPPPSPSTNVFLSLSPYPLLADAARTPHYLTKSSSGTGGSHSLWRWSCSICTRVWTPSSRSPSQSIPFFVCCLAAFPRPCGHTQHANYTHTSYSASEQCSLTPGIMYKTAWCLIMLCLSAKDDSLESSGFRIKSKNITSCHGSY